MNATSYEGIGSSKTVRGILRNRVIGRALSYGNFEFRYRFRKSVIFGQNIYIGLNTFMDRGKTLVKYEIDLERIKTLSLETNIEEYFNKEPDPIHTTLGAGIRFVLNENFVVACDYGHAMLKQDGGGRIYIGLNYLF